MNAEERKEAEGIQYIMEKNDLSDIHIVLVLYNKLTERKLFQTQAGMQFLDELKDRLVASDEIDKKEIYGYQMPDKQDMARSEQKSKKNKKPAGDNPYKYKYYNSLVINMILVIAFLLFFYITTNSKNVNILNYENRLLDKYSAWESQLKERESLVTEREKNLENP